MVRGKLRVLISSQGRTYRSLVRLAIRNPPLILGDLHVSVILHPPCKRRRDLDNFDGKALWDALTKCGVWEDDSQVKSRDSAWGEVVKDGKVVLSITKK
jgi:crossover junction endodeoxyribonuclease RusA